jgi:hypothetical protein
VVEYSPYIIRQEHNPSIQRTRWIVYGPDWKPGHQDLYHRRSFRSQAKAEQTARRWQRRWQAEFGWETVHIRNPRLP